MLSHCIIMADCISGITNAKFIPNYNNICCKTYFAKFDNIVCHSTHNVTFLSMRMHTDCQVRNIC